MDGLMKIGSLLAEAEKDLNMCLLTVLPVTINVALEGSEEHMATVRAQRHAVLDTFIHYAVDRNVPMYTKMITDITMADGVINEIRNDDNVKLVLMAWPGQGEVGDAQRKTLKRLAEEARASLAVLNDRGTVAFNNILVPVGGGLNSRLAVHLANDISMQEGSHVDYVYVVPVETDEEVEEDRFAYLQEIVMTQLGEIPANATLRALHSRSVQEALIRECDAHDYGLIIMGSAYDVTDESLFGAVVDTVVEKVPYSVMVVRRVESATASWLHHQARRLQRH